MPRVLLGKLFDTHTLANFVALFLIKHIFWKNKISILANTFIFN